MPSSRSRSCSKLAIIEPVEFAAARQLDAHRVDKAAVDANFVVHVRAGRQTGGADEADHLALAHALAVIDAARDRRSCGRKRFHSRCCGARVT